jgi:hypothetical protein
VPPSAPAPIWERGYEWKYRWSSLQGSGTFVWEVARDELTSDVPQYVVKTGTREIVYRKADLAWLMERVGGAVETRATPASLGFTWPLAVGKEWEQTYTWENPGQGRTEERTRRYKVEGLVTVTVPAGTFQAFHVTSKDQTGRLVTEYWYSPEVRWWVREKALLSYGFRDRELLEYKLRATGAPAP